ncbi:PREDICTED: protein FAR1-RELATED SEQUENCE 5-like [Fragaria vesca subsp. vesca]|uniref:protein FAR1-RELATED SEQUENCE 5-like n=1 Tax=Fragaria vesca subsp. vesca TaxID=101020 RepID=UPI0002C30BCA|nr:PREDICTED: protein FAR1-RELATED SEQUENCE 5-like [Fragaria vesca subsp. vesca]
MDKSMGIADTEVGNFDLGLDCKPRIGMEFDSEPAAYDFYNRYGGEKGFSIRRESHEHNHPFVAKECSYMLHSQRSIQESQGIEIDLVKDFGIDVTSLYELMSKQAGGRAAVGFTKVDVKNYLRSRRQRSLKYGEAGYIIKYFED